MSFSDWMAETAKRYQNNSIFEATRDSGFELFVGGMRKTGEFINYGQPIWEEEWDVLLILDACRYDAFYEEYQNDPLFDSIEERNSVASTSKEWMNKTFDPEKYHDEMAETVYVSANQFAVDHVDETRLMHLEEVYKYAVNEERGTIFPEKVSDVAISQYKKYQPERMIVHYMQPHYPYIPNEESVGINFDEFGEEDREDEFDMLRKGQITREELWEMYTDNLNYVMDNIKNTILRGIDAEKVVMSADHGEFFGEYGLYEHPEFVPLPPVKKVPWAVTSAQDEGYTPEYEIPEEYDFSQSDRDELLEDLGYK